MSFTTPISDDPIVGVIGGGMAGLACALFLEKRGVRSTVFDTVCCLFPSSFQLFVIGIVCFDVCVFNFICLVCVDYILLLLL